MSLLTNIIVFILVVMGVIVTAATMHDPLWKKRAISAALVLGTVWIGLTLLIDDKASAWLIWIGEKAYAFLDTEYFRLLLAVIIGTLIGNQFSPFRPRIRRKRATTPVPWPNVAEWLTPTEAIDSFCSRESVAAFTAAHNRYEMAVREYEELEAALAESEPDSKTDYAALTRALSRQSNPKLAAAADKQLTAQAEASLARDGLFNDLKRQLEEGVLVGRAVLFQDQWPGDEFEILSPANWVVLRFDPGDPTTVRGGGRTYKGLKIGRPRAAR